jgi:hypothetical protein
MIMSGLTLTTVIERNSGVGATCGVGVGFWATACRDCAAIKIKIVTQNARSSVIGAMCFMKVSFFLGKRGLGVCDMTYKVVNGGCCRARDVMRFLERNCSSERSFLLRIRASVMRRLNRGHLWQNAIRLEDGDQEPRSKVNN